MQLSNEEFRVQMKRLRDKNWSIKHDLTSDNSLALKRVYRTKGLLLTDKNKKFNEKPLLSPEMAFLLFRPPGKGKDRSNSLFGVSDKVLDSISTNSQLQNISNEMVKAQQERVNEEVDRLIAQDPANERRATQLRE